MKGLKRALNRRGMTLIEVVVAILIVAVFSLTLVLTFGSGTALMQKGVRDKNLGVEELSDLEAGGGTVVRDSVSFHVGESSGDFVAQNVTVSGSLLESAAGESGEISLYVFRP